MNYREEKTHRIIKVFKFFGLLSKKTERDSFIRQHNGYQ